MSIAAVPPELSVHDQRIEEMFDVADDLMINKKQYNQAVSAPLTLIIFRSPFTKKS